MENTENLNMVSKSPSLIEIEGVMNAGNSFEFKDKLNKVIESGQENIVCDCSKLECMSEECLGAFTIIHNKAQEKESTIELINVKDEIYEVFDLLGFTKLFKISKKK